MTSASRVWFTADLHLGHRNILKHCPRPFTTVEEMNAALIDNWNRCVAKGDRVYVLGDFSFLGLVETFQNLDRLNGQKFLVAGNHDRDKRKDYGYAARGRGFEWVKDLAEIKIEGQSVVMCHYPLLTWRGSHRGSWNLHGHCHGTLKPSHGGLRYDVGVDCNNYAPVSFETIRDKMMLKTFVTVDHHRAEGEVDL